MPTDISVLIVLSLIHEIKSTINSNRVLTPYQQQKRRTTVVGLSVFEDRIVRLLSCKPVGVANELWDLPVLAEARKILCSADLHKRVELFFSDQTFAKFALAVEEILTGAIEECLTYRTW